MCDRLSAAALSNIATLCSDGPAGAAPAASEPAGDASLSESVARWQAVEEVVSRLRGATGAPDAGALALVAARAAKSGHHAVAAVSLTSDSFFLNMPFIFGAFFEMLYDNCVMFCIYYAHYYISYLGYIVTHFTFDNSYLTNIIN